MNSRAHSTANPVFLRYWGSHFKSRRQASVFAEMFRPMLARGWACHLVLERVPEDSTWICPLQELGVEIHVLPRPRNKSDFGCAKRIRALCRQIGCDLFYCENIHLIPLISASAARVPARIWHKRAMNSHFEECREPGWKERLALSTRLSCRLATRVVTVSSAVKQELVHLGIEPGKILVRPNPRQLSQVPRAPERSECRERLGYDQADLVFVSIGHAVPVKGWDLLIEAFGRLSTDLPQARLLLVGGTERPEEIQFAAELKARVSRLGIENQVAFTGHTQDVAAMLAASDIFVMPSRSEGFSCALTEALEAGLPCIATRVGVAEDVIRSDHNGILVDRNDERSLYDALLKIGLDERLRQGLANNAVVPESIPSLCNYAERMARDLNELLPPALSTSIL